MNLVTKRSGDGRVEEAGLWRMQRGGGAWSTLGSSCGGTSTQRRGELGSFVRRDEGGGGREGGRRADAGERLRLTQIDGRR